MLLTPSICCQAKISCAASCFWGLENICVSCTITYNVDVILCILNVDAFVLL